MAMKEKEFRDSFQATQKLYRHQFLCFQRLAYHVFPYLIGILLSSAWSFVLGFIEVFDSDMELALAYFAFAGLFHIFQLDFDLLRVQHFLLNSSPVLLVGLCSVTVPRPPRNRIESK